MSIGRHPDQSGNFAFLESPTKGSVNSNKKVDPTSSPTPTKTPSPTPSPIATLTPTPTPKPSPTPKKTPTPSPSSQATSTAEPEVLGETIENLLTASPTGEPLVAPVSETHTKLPLVAFVFIVPGIALSLFGALKFLKMRQNEYNDLSESSILRPKN